MKRILSIIFLGTALLAGAQEKGFIRGNIADGDFGGGMIGAAITIAEKPGFGTITDFDGNYSLPIVPGVYTVKVSFISYATQVFSNVEVKVGQPTIIDAVLKSAINELAAVEVVGEVRRNSEIGMLMEMKNSSNVTDGLSQQAFRKIGDADLGGAIRRVTGVTVSNGKYVYVRGLGDRYTKTTLNGMEIPGLDPDVNSVQIDIFPTMVLENVAVYKSFTPDLYGDFTGGLVNVVTKSFPDEKSGQFNIGLTYIPGMHFSKDYVLYNGGKLDWAGFDDGTRKLPIDKLTSIPNVIFVDPQLEEITKSFDPEMAAKSRTAFPNGSFSINQGNQVNRESGSTYGYNMVFNYSNETALYKNFQSNDYLKDEELDRNELFKRVTRVGTVGKNTVMMSALMTGSYKKKKNKLTATLMGSQSGESTAAERINQDFNQNQSTLSEDVLTYTERSLGTLLLNGSHRLGIVDVTWANASSAARVNDPDFRETRVDITEGSDKPALRTGSGAGVDRFWRNLVEFNEGAKFDVKIPITEKAELLAGGLGSFKYREFEVLSYKLRRTNLNEASLDADWFLQPDQVWSADPTSSNYKNGTYVIGNFQPANTFQARQTVFSGYVMTKHSIFKVINLIYGARVEKLDMYYTGQNNSGTERYNDQKTLDALNLLPSISAVYKIGEKVNLRAAANRTIARPSFKEKSIAQIYDPITKRTFIGNIDLEQTKINNYDLRYEYFIGPKELFSIGAFYKQFDGHIELVSFSTAPDNLKPRNSGQAQVFGTEIEFRKGLASFTESKILSRLFFGVNATLVQSMVDLKSVFVDNTGLTEYTLRESNLRVGETLSQFRPMSGQSPYAFNALIAYEIDESQTNISLAYNVQGDQLTIIASGRVPDIYTVPFHSLNFNAYRNFGKDYRNRITIGVANMLDQDRTLVYRSYKAKDEIYTTYKPGIGISAKYSFNF